MISVYYTVYYLLVRYDEKEVGKEAFGLLKQTLLLLFSSEKYFVIFINVYVKAGINRIIR